MNWDLVNKVRIHNRNETMKHFILKSIVVKILFNNKYMVYSEHQIRKGRVADVYAIKAPTDENRIVVEIETKPNKKHNKELMEFYQNETLYIIDVREISNNLIEMEKQIKHILGM